MFDRHDHIRMKGLCQIMLDSPQYCIVTIAAAPYRPPSPPTTTSTNTTVVMVMMHGDESDHDHVHMHVHVDDVLRACAKWMRNLHICCDSCFQHFCFLCRYNGQRTMLDSVWAEVPVITMPLIRPSGLKPHGLIKAQQPSLPIGHLILSTTTPWAYCQHLHHGRDVNTCTMGMRRACICAVSATLFVV